MELNIGIRGHDLDPVNDVETLARTLKTNNIKNIQFAPAISFPHIPFELENINPGMGNYYRKKFETEGVDIAILSCYINMIHPDLSIRTQSLDKFKKYLSLARSFGAEMVATETGCVDAEIHYTEDNFSDEAFEMVVESVQELVAHAEKVGMIVAIEGGKNHPIHTPERMKELIDRVNSKNMQVILDVTNYLMADSYQNQREIIDRSLALFGSDIVAIHLKDFVVKNGIIEPVAIGSGDMDFEYLIKKINQTKPFLNLIMEETKEKDVSNAIKYLNSLI